MIAQIDVALDFAVEKKVFTSRQLAFDDDGLADMSNIGPILIHFGRLHGAGLV
jgi:hypothetical protein